MTKSQNDLAVHKHPSPRSPVENVKLQSILANTELLLAHAAESGCPLDPKTVAAIEAARRNFSKGIWSQEISTEFWPAYSLLCAAIKPVTAESINASTAENLNATLRVYRRFAYALIVLIVPVSVFLFINAGVSSDINEKIASNNELALHLSSLLDPPPSTASSNTKASEVSTNGHDILSKLQQFTTTSRLLFERSQLLNGLVIGLEPEPVGINLQEDPATLEIRKDIKPTQDELKGEFFSQLGKYQKVRAFAKNVQQANLVLYGAFSAYALPVAYAALGACAYALRTMSEQTMARTYRPSHHVFARVVIALIGGLVVGLFNNFTQGISLPPLAIAFLVGYAVEVFFSFLDAFLETLRKVHS